jgi:hypothetical protein
MCPLPTRTPTTGRGIAPAAGWNACWPKAKRPPPNLPMTPRHGGGVGGGRSGVLHPVAPARWRLRGRRDGPQPARQVKAGLDVRPHLEDILPAWGQANRHRLRGADPFHVLGDVELQPAEGGDIDIRWECPFAGVLRPPPAQMAGQASPIAGRGTQAHDPSSRRIPGLALGGRGRQDSPFHKREKPL